MKKVSDEFIDLSKKIKIQDLKLTINDGEITVQEVHLMPVNIFNAIPISRLRARKQVIAKELKYSFEGQLFKTIMQQIEITVKNVSEIKGKYVDFQYGIQINDKFEYVDMGEYYIKDVEDDKNKKELVVTGYDKMLNFMKTFKQAELQLTYPCKMSRLVNRMGEVCEVELYSTDFFNSDLIIDEDFFTAQELTYRDVLEKVAQATLTTIFIKEGKLYLCKISDSVQTLDTSFLSNLVIEEKFGPVNALVLGRGSVEDNVEYVNQNSINTNGRCEIRFDENEFVDSKREEVIDSMLQQIDGLEYYAIEASNLGLLWLDPCDVITTKGREESEYKSIYLKASVTINTGIKGEMGASIPETTTTEYKVTTKEEKKALKVERLAKKNEGLIQDIIEQNTKTATKLSEHTQTIDSMKDTLKSQETKIETVETKADNAQETADTANTNAQNAQKTADENATQITTTTTKLAEVEKTVDGITQSVSAVEEKIETVESTTDSINKNLEKNYYTKTETENKITQTAESTISEVSKTYSTKEETETAKTDAIDSANSSTDDKLKDYTVTSELGTWIEQNYEHVKVAWNQISEFIQMMIINNNASFAILDENKNIMMALDKTGQHFYSNTGELIGDIGLIENSTEKQIAFAINGNNSGNSMCWGIKRIVDGEEKYFPIFYYGGYNTSDSESEFAGIFYLEAPLTMQENRIYLAQDDNGPYIQGFDNEERKSITFDNVDDISFRDANNNEILVFNSEYLKLFEQLEMGLNIDGNYSFDFKGNYLTNMGNVATGTDVDYFGSSGSYLYVGLRSGGGFSLWPSSSDSKLKKNIKNSKVRALEIIKKIAHRQFTWKDTNKHQNIGYIAQEMQKIDDNFVHHNTFNDKNGEKVEEWQINILSVLATATKAIQEQQEQIEQLQEKEKQKDEIIADLIKRIETLEKEVNK